MKKATGFQVEIRARTLVIDICFAMNHEGDRQAKEFAKDPLFANGFGKPKLITVEYRDANYFQDSIFKRVVRLSCSDDATPYFLCKAALGILEESGFSVKVFDNEDDVTYIYSGKE